MAGQRRDYNNVDEVIEDYKNGKISKHSIRGLCRYYKKVENSIKYEIYYQASKFIHEPKTNKRSLVFGGGCK